MKLYVAILSLVVACSCATQKPICPPPQIIHHTEYVQEDVPEPADVSLPVRASGPIVDAVLGGQVKVVDGLYVMPDGATFTPQELLYVVMVQFKEWERAAIEMDKALEPYRKREN